jgi:hypothetical protein
MFNWIGKQATDGAIERIKSFILDTPWSYYSKQFPIIGILLRIEPDIKAGYDKMTPDEKADFWKSVMIMGAKIGAAAA